MIECIYLHHKSESFRLLSHTEKVQKEIEMMVLDMKPRYLYAVSGKSHRLCSCGLSYKLSYLVFSFEL